MSEDADQHAEIDDLVRTLRSYGGLTKNRLLELSGARHWPEHTFEIALRDAVAEGRVRKLSEDLYEVSDAEL